MKQNDLTDRTPQPQQWLTPWRFGVILAALLFAVFPRVLLGTHSFFFRDYGVLGYPFIHYARESFWRGELPLWNPLSNCGAPFLAQWGTMTLYPFSLIYLVLPLPWSLSLFCFAHLFLAGLGMYRLASRWLDHPLAAALAGTAFVFNGFTFSCLIWPNYMVALGWMPWVVLLAEKAWRQGRGQILLAALVSALQMLTGVPEIVLLTWVVVVALCGLEVWLGPASGGGGHAFPAGGSTPAVAVGAGPAVKPSSGARAGVMVLRLAFVVLLTAGLAAVQLLPFFDLLAHSQRQAGGLPMKWAMPGWGGANLLVPLFHCFETPQGQFFQEGQAFLSSYYLGIGVLGLAVWAACRVRLGRVWLLWTLGLLGLILALGDQTPLYRWFKSVLPVAGLVRYPVKFVALTAFVTPLLAGFAVRALAQRFGSASQNEAVGRVGVWRELAFIAAVALVLVAGLLWLAWRDPHLLDQWGVTFRNAVWRLTCLVALLAILHATLEQCPASRWIHGALGVGLMALLAADAATHSPKQNPTLPGSVYLPGLWGRAFEFKPPQFGEARLMISSEAEAALLNSRIKDQENNFISKRLAEWSNLNLLDNIPKVNGSSTLQLREQMQVQAMLYAVTNRSLDGLMDLLGVSRVSAPGKVVEWSSRTNQLALVTAGQRPVFVDGTNALAGLAATDFDPRETVFLPREVEPQVVSREKTPVRVQPVRFSANRIEFEIESGGPALVVIAQSFYHPWEAEVDGQAVPLWRANHAFQALEVPGGKHWVRVAYRDRNLRSGAALSAATLLGMGLFWLRRKRLDMETKKA
jgi:hypothetical protein